MDKPIELSLEQEFSLRSFRDKVALLNKEQAQDFLVKLYEQMLLRETIYRQLIRNQWDIGPINSD